MGSNPGKLSIKTKPSKRVISMASSDEGGGEVKKQEKASDPDSPVPAIQHLSDKEQTSPLVASNEEDMSDSDESAVASDSVSQLGDDQLTETSSKPKKKKVKKLTEEEIVSKKETTTKKFSKYLNIFQDNSEEKAGDNTPEVESNIKTLQSIFNSAFSLRGAPLKEVAEFRNGLGLILVDSSLIPILCKLIVDTLTGGYRSAQGIVQSSLYQPMKRSMLILINYSDYSTAVAEKICAVPGFMEFVRDKLVELFQQHKESQLQVSHW